jgi:hypothetical protein
MKKLKYQIVYIHIKQERHATLQMNFNRNERNKEEKGGRFSKLKVESNHFKNNNGKNNSQRRVNPLKNGEPKLNKTVSLMDLVVNTSRTSSELSNISSSYVAPNQRNRNNNNGFQNSKRENNFKSKRDRKPKKVEPVAPNFENKKLFPTLNTKNVITDQNNPWSKKLVVKEEKTEEDIDETKNESEGECEDSGNESDSSESENENINQASSWVEMTTVRKYQDKSVKEDHPRFIKPGWVRISYDKQEHQYVYEYGAEVPESYLMKLIREEEKRRKQIEWEKRIQEWEEYDEYMGHTNNYYYSWQADEVDAERELDARIAQMEQEEYEEENASDIEGNEMYDY